MYLLTALTILTLSSAAELPSKPSTSVIPQTILPNEVQTHSFHSSLSSTTFGDTSIKKSEEFDQQKLQQDIEKNAFILKQDRSVENNGNYHYTFETSNGILSEEERTNDNVQGSFSYKGDDGVIYSIIYTSGPDGFKPQGSHIPVPPPVPEEILKSLEKNSKDEADGIFDDGTYQPEPNFVPLESDKRSTDAKRY